MAINLIVADLTGRDIDTSDAGLLKLLAHVPEIQGKTIRGEVLLFSLNHGIDSVSAVLIRMLDERIDLKHLTVLIKDVGSAVDNVTMGRRMNAFIRDVLRKVNDPRMTTRTYHLRSGDFIVTIHADLSYLESLLVNGARARMKAHRRNPSPQR